MSNCRIVTSPIFDKYAKKYSKKFVGFKSSLKVIEKKLIENPTFGTPLGNGLYKIRVPNTDKNKGKSAGYRIITYCVIENNKNTEIIMVIVYDKSEISNIPKKDLLEIVKEII